MGQRAKTLAAVRSASLPTARVYTALGSRESGLSDNEARERLRHHGKNELPRPRERPWYHTLAQNFLHFFALLLWAAAALSWVAGMPELTWAIAVVVLINGLFSFWQEREAARAVAALEALLPKQVRVVRHGLEQEIDAALVVPGDVLVLEEGALVPADARLVTADLLRVDLSPLTGESRPLLRSPDSPPGPGHGPGELKNLVYAGTTVARGRGRAVVFATGANTEFGRIAQLTYVKRERPSPLEREMRKVIRFVTVFAVLVGVLCFFAGTLLGGLTPAMGFVFAIGIIVANVPEGLLPTLTLSLAMAVRRMARRRALVKRLSAVEALGATTVILTDKTGTLTENEMTVRELWTPAAQYQVTGRGYARDGSIEVAGEVAGGSSAAMAMLDGLLRAAALCCDARLGPDPEKPGHWHALGDPTEVAILVAAAKADLAPETLASMPRLGELPFDSDRKLMTAIHEIDGTPVACMKGALSQVIERCTALRGPDGTRALDRDTSEEVTRAGDRMAERGLRVLAVAHAQADDWSSRDVEQGLTLLGLVAMEDPPRSGVTEAVASCHRAGIRVQMVTGDAPLTAAAIGREIGLYRKDPQVLTGVDLDAMSDDALHALLDEPELLFARVAPEHKLRLVRAHQRRGEIVAVTGDGVNDAPALKQADIGVAMGATGTDVAREAAAMVLTDDDFSSIVAAVREGRAVYDNIRKFVTYIFASNVPEIFPFVAFVLFDIPLPLTVMQILAVDLGTDVLPALALGAEPAEPDVMDRPPRSRRTRLLDFRTLARAYGWLGALEATMCLGGYFFAYWQSGWQPGTPLAATGNIYVTATTMSLAGIVACQIGNLFACLSPRHSICKLHPGRNRMLLLGIFAEIFLLVALIYTPPLAHTFGLAPLGPSHWLLLATFAPALLLLEEARKALVNRTRRNRPSRIS